VFQSPLPSWAHAVPIDGGSRTNPSISLPPRWAGPVGAELPNYCSAHGCFRAARLGCPVQEKAQPSLPRSARSRHSLLRARAGLGISPQPLRVARTSRTPLPRARRRAARDDQNEPVLLTSPSDLTISAQAIRCHFDATRDVSNSLLHATSIRTLRGPSSATRLWAALTEGHASHRHHRQSAACSRAQAAKDSQRARAAHQRTTLSFTTNRVTIMDRERLRHRPRKPWS